MTNPTVLRQAWILIHPDGSHSPLGYSSHRDEADRHAFVSDYLVTASPIDLGGQEEPSGDPTWVFVSERVFAQVCETAHGFRVR